MLMKLTKSDLSDLYNRALNLVKNKPAEFFNLRKMRGTMGLCYYTDIELDYRRELVGTAFHELFHYMHPEWSESMILYAESRVMNYCTPLQIATFLKFLANKLYKSEKIKDYFHEVAAKKKTNKKNKR